ncbi:MAG: DUF4007 family protein [Actinobacteria bacterium]|nr:DUF4007 family protein [Actinomycetota bacterium]
MNKLTFSGHESFHCRSLWLKKGDDFIARNKMLGESGSVVDLCCGRILLLRS